MAIFHKTLQYHEDTTKKRELNQEDVEFLKRLQLEMNTQDTTGTADPRFWVIKGSERAINNEDPDELLNGSDECVMQDASANFNADSFDDLMHGCPLKSLPEKMTGVAPTDHWNSIKAGWNGCIDEITGGEADGEINRKI